MSFPANREVDSIPLQFNFAFEKMASSLLYLEWDPAKFIQDSQLKVFAVDAVMLSLSALLISICTQKQGNGFGLVYPLQISADSSIHTVSQFNGLVAFHSANYSVMEKREYITTTVLVFPNNMMKKLYAPKFNQKYVMRLEEKTIRTVPDGR